MIVCKRDVPRKSLFLMFSSFAQMRIFSIVTLTQRQLALKTIVVDTQRNRVDAFMCAHGDRDSGI